MTLIDIIICLRRNGCRYCAVDKSGQVWGYNTPPTLHAKSTHENPYWTHDQLGDAYFVGQFELTGDWKKTMFDLNDINV